MWFSGILKEDWMVAVFLQVSYHQHCKDVHLQVAVLYFSIIAVKRGFFGKKMPMEVLQGSSMKAGGGQIDPRPAPAYKNNIHQPAANNS